MYISLGNAPHFPPSSTIDSATLLAGFRSWPGLQRQKKYDKAGVFEPSLSFISFDRLTPLICLYLFLDILLGTQVGICIWFTNT